MKKITNLCLAFNSEEKRIGFYYTNGDIVNAGRSFLRKRKENLVNYHFVKISDILFPLDETAINQFYRSLDQVLREVFKVSPQFKQYTVVNRNKTILAALENLYFEEFNLVEKIDYSVWGAHPEYDKGWLIFKEMFDNEKKYQE